MSTILTCASRARLIILFRTDAKLAQQHQLISVIYHGKRETSDESTVRGWTLIERVLPY